MRLSHSSEGPKSDTLFFLVANFFLVVFAIGMIAIGSIRPPRDELLGLSVFPVVMGVVSSTIVILQWRLSDRPGLASVFVFYFVNSLVVMLIIVLPEFHFHETTTRKAIWSALGLGYCALSFALGVQFFLHYRRSGVRPK
jgi:hypothetical protein